MKKAIVVLLFVSLLIFGCGKSGAGSAEGSPDGSPSMSQEQKAIAALENFYRCWGKGDYKNMPKYATEYVTGVDCEEIIAFTNHFVSSEMKDVFKNYKIDVDEIEFIDGCYYITVNFPNDEWDCAEIIQEGNAWKINDLNVNINAIKRNRQ